MALGHWALITGQGLSEQPILITDMATSTLLNSKEEGMGEKSIHRCTIKASTAYAWPHASPEAHTRCCRWHTGWIKKGEQGREVARREKGTFVASGYWPNHLHVHTNMPACLLGAGGELTLISQRTVALPQQGTAG